MNCCNGKNKAREWAHRGTVQGLGYWVSEGWYVTTGSSVHQTQRQVSLVTCNCQLCLYLNQNIQPILACGPRKGVYNIAITGCKCIVRFKRKRRAALSAYKPSRLWPPPSSFSGKCHVTIKWSTIWQNSENPKMPKMTNPRKSENSKSIKIPNSPRSDENCINIGYNYRGFRVLGF